MQTQTYRRFWTLLWAYAGTVALLAVSGVGLQLLLRVAGRTTPLTVVLLLWVFLVLLRHPLPGERRLRGLRSASRVQQAVSLVTVVVTAIVTAAGVDFWFEGDLAGVAAGLAGVAGFAYWGVFRRTSHGGLRLHLTVRELSAAGVLTALLVAEFVAGFFEDSPVVPVVLGAVAAALLFTEQLAERVSWFARRSPFERIVLPLIGLALALAAVTSTGEALFWAGMILLPVWFAAPELYAIAGRLGGRRRVVDLLKEPEDPIERAIGRIKGTYRRVAMRTRWEAGEEIPDELLFEDAGMGNKFALGAQNPQMRGGEDLPDLLPGEVELARITLLKTTHGEVTCLRAIRAGDDAMDLRMVDEYETEFALPFDRAQGTLADWQIVDLFARAEPSPLEAGPYAVHSDRFPDLLRAFADRFPDEMRPEDMPGTVAIALRLWARLLLLSVRWAVRGTFDFRGSAATLEIRAYITIALIVRGLVNALVPEAAPLLYLLLVPTPALVVRRIRAIGVPTFKADLPKVVLGAVFGGVAGATLLNLPLLWGPLLAAYLVAILYVAYRQGPTEDRLLARQLGL